MNLNSVISIRVRPWVRVRPRVRVRVRSRVRVRARVRVSLGPWLSRVLVASLIPYCHQS